MSNKNKGIVFAYYTFQLSAKKNTGDVVLLDGTKMDIKKIISQKNKLFADALVNKTYRFSYKSYSLNHKLIYAAEPYYVFRIANYKKLKAEKNFKEVYYDNEPSILVVIQNIPSKQTIAIQKDSSVFSSVDSISLILKNTIWNILHEYELKPEINNKFDEKEFWDLISKHKDIIKSIKFEFVKENNEELYRSISEEISDFSKDINSHKTVVQYTAPDDGYLEKINQKNKRLQDMVHTSSLGTAPITVKIGGHTHTISTKNKTITKEFGDIEIEGKTKEDIAYILKQIFKDAG